MSVVLYPRDGPLRTFEEVRKPFYVSVILYALLEVPYYEVGELVRPSYYWYAWISIGLYYIESFYNPERRHQHIRGVSPEVFETTMMGA